MTDLSALSNEELQALYGRAKSRPAGKPTELQRDLGVAAVAPGSPDAVLAGRRKAGLEPPLARPAAASSAVSQKVKDRQNAIGVIRKQLVDVRRRFEPLKGTFSAGPGGDYIPSEGGQAFDASVSAMAPLIRQVTRTPGEGATSDYEARLAESILPSRGKYESVTEQQIAQLEQILNQLDPAGAPKAPVPPEKARVIEAFKGGPDTPERRDKARRLLESSGQSFSRGL